MYNIYINIVFMYINFVASRTNMKLQYGFTISHLPVDILLTSGMCW